jgi:hypothetical protein
VEGDWKTSTVDNRHDFGAIPRSASDRPSGFFRRRESRIDERLTQINLPAVVAIFGEALWQLVKPTRSVQELEAAVTRLVRRIVAREVGPTGRPCAEPHNTAFNTPCGSVDARRVRRPDREHRLKDS